MAMVSVAEFQQHMAQQSREKEAMQERVSELHQSIVEIRGQIAIVEASSENKTTQVIDACDRRMTDIEVRGNQLISDTQCSKEELSTLEKQIKELMSNADTNFNTLHDNTEASFGNLRNQTEETFVKVRERFDELQLLSDQNNAKFEVLYTKTEVSFQDMQQRVASLGRVHDDGHQGGQQSQQEQVGRKGYFPLKSIVPEKIDDKIDDWRAWKEDTVDFLDTQFEGMGKFLTEIISKHQGTEAELEDAISSFVGKDGLKYNEEDSVMVWPALKRLTEGMAQKIVTNTRK